MLNVKEPEQVTSHLIFPPIWDAVIFVEIPNDDITELRPIIVGNGMTKLKAWETARAAMDSRRGAVAMTVRLNLRSI